MNNGRSINSPSIANGTSTVSEKQSDMKADLRAEAGRFSEEQIIGISKEHKAGVSVAELRASTVSATPASTSGKPGSAASTVGQPWSVAAKRLMGTWRAPSLSGERMPAEEILDAHNPGVFTIR